MMPNKTPTKAPHKKHGLPRKVIYTLIAVVFVVVGLAGLVIPIIPGILFLFGAVYLLSQVSERVHSWSEQQAWMHGVRVRMIQMGGLKPFSRIRFAALLAARAIVDGANRAAELFDRWLPKRS